MPASFKLIHLSDLHFAYSPNRLPSPIQTDGVGGLLKAIIDGHRGNWFKPASHSTRAARALSRYLCTQLLESESPDVIMVTGDLAATGRRRDLAVAFEFLSHSGDDWVTQDDEPRLVSGRVPVRVMPGNHDRYQSETLLPGSFNFESYFSDRFWEPTDYCERLSKSFVMERDGERLALLCADFSFRQLADASSSPIAFVGRGVAYSDVIDGLRRSTADLQTEGAAVVWLVHYPPAFPGVDPNLSLEDESLLIEAANACKVKLLFAGHTHEAKIYSVGEALISCVGSATQHDPASQWHFALAELEVSGGEVVAGNVTSFDYQKSGRNNFVRGSSQAI